MIYCSWIFYFSGILAAGTKKGDLMMNPEIELSFAERQTPPWKWDEFSQLETMTDEVIEAGCIKVDILTMSYDEEEENPTAYCCWKTFPEFWGYLPFPYANEELALCTLNTRRDSGDWYEHKWRY